MDDMTAQMNSILGNPEMMQKIMSMANSLQNSQEIPEQNAPSRETSANPFPDLDLATIQKLAGFAGTANIDSNQRCLLNALNPYLSKERLYKLEKAMRAAKLAGMASLIFGNSGSPFHAGR